MDGFVGSLLLLVVILLGAGLLYRLAERLAIPHTVLLAVFGLAIGSFALVTGAEGPMPGLVAGLDVAINGLSIEADVILVVFLPVLLFQAGLMVDVRRMMDDVAPVLLLAVVAVVLCTFSIGFALEATGMAPLAICLLVGAIVATTDPVAVIGVFREVGAPRRLTILVEGESLLNDAAAIVLFGLFLDLATRTGDASGADAVWTFVVVFLGGGLVGWAGAHAMAMLLALVRGLVPAEIMLTLVLPYVVYIVADYVLDVSGVVAVVIAALVTAATGRVQVSPGGWNKLVLVWEQVGFWFSTLIFLLASMLVPQMLADADLVSVLLVGLVAAAAFASRAVVLFVLMPLLTRARLAERVAVTHRLVILWGGLRGAVTLALALSVVENDHVPPEYQRFVAVLATGFVLFTLLVNATTLRLVMGRFGLDRLTPLDAGLRNRAVAMAVTDVLGRIGQIAERNRVDETACSPVFTDYKSRLEAADVDAANLPVDREGRMRLGLVALATHEEELYIAHFEERTIGRATVLPMLATVGRLRDAAKTSGGPGYDAVIARSLAFGPSFRAAQWLQRRLGFERPLARRLAQRFEVLLISRMVVDDLAAFADSKLRLLLGRSTADGVTEHLARRRRRTGLALDALRLQYPAYARTLENRFLRQVALRLEEEQYRQLFAEGVIGQEVVNDLMRRVSRNWAKLAERPPLDLELGTAELVAGMPLFRGLPPERIAELSRHLVPRVALPDQWLMREGEEGSAMYFIASGAVEVTRRGREDDPILLGRGEVVGELALLGSRPRTASVRAVAYCQLLELSRRAFQRFLEANPDLRSRIEEIASTRLAQIDNDQAGTASPTSSSTSMRLPPGSRT